MDLAQATHPRNTPLIHVYGNDQNEPPEPPADPDTTSTALNIFYNQCVLEGCRSVLKGGRLHVREGMRGQYKCVENRLGDSVRLNALLGTSRHS
jgi:hypothetical protein